MKIDATLARMRDGALETQRCRKMAPRFVEFKVLANRNRRNGFCRIHTRSDLQKLPQIFQFLPQDLVIPFQNLMIILARFSTLKDHK